MQVCARWKCHGKVSVEVAMFECLIDDVTLHFALGIVLRKVECFKQAHAVNAFALVSRAES